MEYNKIKNILCTEIDNTIEDIMRNGKMSVNDLEILDKLTHSYKSILTSEAMEDNGYSYNNGYSETYKRGNIEKLSNMEYPSNYYERGYSNMRYSDNYSGRRYSRDEGKTHMIHQFEKLMDTTSNPEEREILQSAINRLNNM